MKTWRRARQAVPCGGPHDRLVVIPVGAPMLVFTTTAHRALYRCEACAGEAAPWLPPLPGLDPVERPPAPMTRVSRSALLTVLPFDYKTAQVGKDRE